MCDRGGKGGGGEDEFGTYVRRESIPVHSSASALPRPVGEEGGERGESIKISSGRFIPKIFVSAAKFIVRAREGEREMFEPPEPTRSFSYSAQSERGDTRNPSAPAKFARRPKLVHPV